MKCKTVTATREKWYFFTDRDKAEKFADKHGLKVSETPDYMAESMFFPFICIKYERIKI